MIAIVKIQLLPPALSLLNDCCQYLQSKQMEEWEEERRPFFHFFFVCINSVAIKGLQKNNFYHHHHHFRPFLMITMIATQSRRIGWVIKGGITGTRPLFNDPKLSIFYTRVVSNRDVEIEQILSWEIENCQIVFCPYWHDEDITPRYL